MCLSTFQNKGDGNCRDVGVLIIVIWSAFSSITIGRSRLSIDCSGSDALKG
jgi:hypothetical protein